MTFHILLENGASLLTENGDFLVLESEPNGIVAGGFVTFPAAVVSTLLAVGDRYYVTHAADQTPEKFGRVALTDGVWQGGDVFCDISHAYPDSIGPFYLIKTGTQGTLQGLLHQRPFLDSDAKRRAM